MNVAKYQYKVRQVEGFQITDIEHRHCDHVPGRACKVLVEKTQDASEWINCDEGMTARFYPSVGDYVVIQPDGYVYLNPKKVFEEKFEKVGE
jgi:hypothetical protein